LKADNIIFITENCTLVFLQEFFMLLLRELLDPKYGMFKVYESNMQWFSPFVSTSIHVVTAF